MKTKLLVLCTTLFVNCLIGQTFTNQTSLLNATSGSSPCVVDMNADGLDDIVTIHNNGGTYDVYIDYQQTDGTFTLTMYDTDCQNYPSWSIAAGDLNNDGYNDLMFGGGSRVSFILSNSTGTAYTEQYINDYIFSQRTNMADIDGDGNLDAFACHDVDQSHPYRNDGTGFMSEDQSLLPTLPLAGNYASIFTDFDNDGDQDLYIAKCRQGSVPQQVERQNALYVNDGMGNFSSNVIADYGLFDDEQSWVTIFEDFDNDGDLDSYTVNHTAQNYLRANDGTGNYTEISSGSGIDVSDLSSWACVGADFDNDGLVDILTESNVSKEFYHNDGGMTFTGSSLPFDKGGLGDLNNDGYIDVFTGGTLWMNDGGSNSHLKVALTGTNSNLSAIGARVECYSDLGMQIRECRSGENFKPMSSLDVFFGLGADTEVDSVIVRWPSGQVDKITAPAINDRLVVIETLLPSLIRLTNVDPYSQEITIKNFGGESEDISAYRLCSELSCTADLSSLTIASGDFDLAAGEEMTLSWTTGLGFTIAGSDMALFLPTGDMNTAAVMVDFTQWGSGGNGSESVAVAKGIWTAGDFMTLGLDYSYTGIGAQNGVSYWQESEFCPNPSDGQALNLTVTGGDLSWTENGSATTWDLEIGLADFNPTGTPTNTGVTNPFAYSGAQGTTYDFYVRADCASSGGIGISNWAGPFRFTVPLPVSTCADAIDVSVGGTFNTGFIDGVIEVFGTCLASSPDNGNWFIYTAPGNGTLNVSSVGLSGVDTQVTVGEGTCGALTPVACNDDFSGPPYESEVEFEVVGGNDYYLMWTDGWTANASDFEVDFTPAPICDDPSNLMASNITGSGADISWTENGTASYWELEIGSTGFTPTGAPTNSSFVDSFTLSGSIGQSYDIYVRSDCATGGGAGYSEWIGPLTVTLVNAYPGYDWLDFREETPTRLVVTSVANSDDEEKDMAVADLDNDGFDDVIVVRKEPFSVSTEGAKSDMLLMNENGVLTDRTTVYASEFITTETFARDLYIDDFDGDGWKDVIIANTFDQQPQYYANQGNDASGNWLGLADETATRFPTLTGDALLFCAVWGGDIDGDLDQDLYFVNYKQGGGGGVAKDFLLINDGTGVFTDESEARLGDLRNSAFGTSVQIHDMDNDGDQDILKVSTLFSVLPWGGNGLFVLFNDGTGNYSNWQNIAPAAPYMFEVADYNSDGLLDVFVVDDAADYLVTVNSFVPDTSLSITKTFVVNGLSGFGGNVHAADLDLDGDLDIAVSDVDVDIPPCDSGRKIALLENQGGVFVDHHNNDVFDWQVNSYDLGILDVNKDGLPDFITGGCAGYNVFMSDNCDLVTLSADYDGDGLSDACDPCPANPDPNCAPEVDFPVVGTDGSVARQWNELLLESIRKDFARPTVHARNLFHTSVGMWDTWAVYNDTACTFLLGQTVDGFECSFDSVPTPADIPAARDEALSYMAYRLLSHRFSNSPNAGLLQMAYDAHMDSLGYDINVVAQDYVNGAPAALGNYVAQCIINFGLQDGSNEQNDYENQRYNPVNPPMIVAVPGNESLEDFNRWQPLSLDLFIDQSGNEIPGTTPEFLSPEWGQVSPFALDEVDKVTYNRDNFEYEVYHDPGTPPLMDTTGVNDSEDYRWGFMTTMLWSSHLDATDGVMWDISPASIGKRDVLPATAADYPSFYNQMSGGTTSPGHAVNPSTGQPYATNMVPRADYARVLAEFWADGPDSETPPGHWFTLLNYVSDHDSLEKKFMGQGEVLDDLEWDVKSYFMMGGAMHDAAVSTWGIKGWHDYLRPVSAIRAMASKGQSSDPSGDSYHPAGVPLIPGSVEVIQTGDPLAGDSDEFVGDIKIKSWRGHKAINNIDVDEAGVGWIYASEWEPYQRPSFVTPPFAGYISGHSTFSRAAAEIMTSLTGDAYFPGGMGTFTATQDEFLVFEDGPSVSIELQWATYQDAADESGLSRIWGGIHPPCDDIPGRKNGVIIGQDVFAKAVTYFGGGCSLIEPCSINEIADGGNQSACDNGTNTYSHDVTVSYIMAPGSGTLDVNGQSFAITGSPQTVTLTGLTADGSSVNVTASFSDDGACTSTVNDVFTAPTDCTPVGLINDDCAGAIDLTPALFGVPAWQTYTREGATQSSAGCQGNADDDIWFIFTAGSSNDYILAQSVGGQFDAVVEVYSACGGASLGCYNNYGTGDIERVIPGGLIAGQSYAFRVYSAETTASTADVRVQVKTFADGMVQAPYCGNLEYSSQSTFTVERQDIQELYSNPGVKVKGYGVDFTDSSAPSSTGLDQIGTGQHNFSFGNVPGLLGDIPYDVSVRHGLNIEANGANSFYWSDYGTTCVMGLSGAIGGLTNDDCGGAIDIVPALFGVSAWQSYIRAGATQSLAGCQGSADDDIWFSFTAGSSNDYILAQSVGGQFDAVVEVFSACGGPSLGCYNNYGTGAIERVIPGGLVAGQSYVFRVFSAGATASAADVRVQVKTFADGMVQAPYCGVTDYSAQAHFTVERQDIQELYSNPGVKVKGYGVDFTDPSGPSSTGHDQIGIALYGFTFGDVPGLQGGIPYDVSVRHGLNIEANGANSFYWSDYGTSCVMGLAGGAGGLTNDECADAINLTPALFGAPAWQTYTRSGATQSLAGCQGTADDDIWFSFTAESSNDNILVQSFGNPFDAVVEVYSACGVASLGCFNNYGAGAVERVIPGGLVAGQSYVFRVYSAGATPVAADVRVQVKTFADGMVQAAYCGDLGYSTLSTFTVERQDIQELYNNPGVHVKGYGVDFTDSSAPSSTVLDQIGNGLYDFTFGDAPGLQGGIPYDVSVRHALNINANGSVDFYWSDYGTSCVMGLTGGAMAPPNGDETADIKLFNDSGMDLTIYPNPNDGNEFRISIDGLSENGTAEIFLRDIQGRLIDSRTFVYNEKSDFVWKTSSTLEAGIYLLETKVDNQRITRLFAVE